MRKILDNSVRFQKVKKTHVYSYTLRAAKSIVLTLIDYDY